MARAGGVSVWARFTGSGFGEAVEPCASGEDSGVGVGVSFAMGKKIGPMNGGTLRRGETFFPKRPVGG